MINIPSSPSKIGTVLEHDVFVFASKSRNNIPVPGLSIIINQANVDQYVCVLPRIAGPSNARIPFYLQHTDLFANAQKVFNDLFGVEPDVLLIYAYKNDYTKSSFLFANRKHISDAKSKTPISFHYSPHTESTTKTLLSKVNKELKQERPTENIRTPEKGNEFEFTLPPGIFPVVASYNDLVTEDKNPSFSLIFGSRFSDKFYKLNKDLKEDSVYNEHRIEPVHDWEERIDSELKKEFRMGMPLYCIKNFNLKNAANLPSYNPTNMTSYFYAVNKSCADDFAIVICNLLLSYSRGTYLPTTRDEFASCMPHFYKVDRTETSVKNTQSLQIKLKNLYYTADDYSSLIGNLNFKDFIEFFILESIIDFELFLKDPGEELYKALVHKRTMAQLVGESEMLSDFLNKRIPNNDFRAFVANQVNAKYQVQPYL